MRMSFSCCMMLTSRKIQSILIGIMKDLHTLQDKSEAECKTDFRFEKYDILYLSRKQASPIHLFSNRGNGVTATSKLPINELNQNIAIRRPENITYRDFAALESI